MKPTDREIERSQPPGTTPVPDPGAGLREHVETARPNAGPDYGAIPAPQPRYIWHIHNRAGGYVGTEPPERDHIARSRAETIGGFVTAALVVGDYRQVPHAG